MILTHSFLPIAALVLPAMGTRLELMPRQTSPAEKREADPAPEPTDAPEPRWGRMALDRRQDEVGTDTCGFLSIDENWFTMSCGSGYTCTNSDAYRGCCQSSTCTEADNYWTTCYDATASQCSGSVGINDLCCTTSSAFPFCVTYLWSTTASPGRMFTQYNCDQSTYSGNFVLDAEPPETTSSSSTRSSRTSSGSSSTRTSSSFGISVIVPTTSPNPQPESSSTPVGPIVGGVVGGVAALAILGFLIFFYMRKKKKAAAGYAPPPLNQNPDMAQGGGFAAGAVSAGSPGFDPRYSVAPTSTGYPSPEQAPGTFAPSTVAGSTYGSPPMAQHEFYKPPGQDAGSVYTAPGGSPNPEEAAKAGFYAPPPQNTIYEAPATNSVGTGVNRAELA